MAIVLVIALAACRKDEPQAPTAQQSTRLNEAEDMLNSMDGNTKEGPAERSAGPSNSTE